jgi:hypothetical protein
MAPHWDKLLLISVLVILGGGGAWLGLDTSDFSQKLSAVQTQKASAKAILPIDITQLTQKQEAWLRPPPWLVNDKDHQLFVGRRYYYFPSTSQASLVDNEMPFFGLPYSFIEKYQLPINDVLIASRDGDGDGFTNKAELDAQTNPRDPQSRPDYATLLRMKSFTAKRYRLTLKAKLELEGQEVYQLATPDSPKRVNFLKRDDQIDHLKVINFRALTKEPEAPDYVTDVSELELLNLKTNEKVILQLGKEKDIPETSASIVILIPGLIDQPTEVKVGSEFTIKIPLSNELPPVELSLKLVTANATSATLLNLSTKTTFVVALLKEADLDLIAKPQ